MPRDHFHIVIEGIGPHHGNSTSDADHLARELCRDLNTKGHALLSVRFTPGGPDIAAGPGHNLPSDDLGVIAPDVAKNTSASEPHPHAGRPAEPAVPATAPPPTTAPAASVPAGTGATRFPVVDGVAVIPADTPPGVRPGPVATTEGPATGPAATAAPAVTEGTPAALTDADFDGMSKDELKEYAAVHHLTVERSDGSEGEPLKEDYLNALKQAHS